MAQLTQSEQDFLGANVDGSVSRLLSDADRMRYKVLRAKAEINQGVYQRLVNAHAQGLPPESADVALLRATPFVCERVATWLLAAIDAGATAAVKRGG